MASKACFFVTIFKLSSLTIYSLSAAQVNKVSATVVEKRKHEWCPRNISYSQGRRETGGEITPGPQALTGLITPNTSRSGDLIE